MKAERKYTYLHLCKVQDALTLYSSASFKSVQTHVDQTTKLTSMKKTTAFNNLHTEVLKSQICQQLLSDALVSMSWLANLKLKTRAPWETGITHRHWPPATT